MSAVFDRSKLDAILKKAKEAAGNNNNNQNRTQYTKTAYLPEGTHKIRFFHDPKGEMIRSLRLHQTGGKRCLCPNLVNNANKQNPNWAETVQNMNEFWKAEKLTELPKCAVCEAAEEIDHWSSGLGLKFPHMVYGHLYDTDKPSKYWEPGSTYAIIGKKKMKDAIISFLEVMAADAPDFLMTMLQPTVAGNITSVKVVSGTQGSVTLNAIPGQTKEPIFKSGEEPEWYRPLDNVFMGLDFDLDAYDGMKELAATRLADHRARIAAGEKTAAQLEAEEAEAKAAAETAETTQTTESTAATNESFQQPQHEVTSSTTDTAQDKVANETPPWDETETSTVSTPAAETPATQVAQTEPVKSDQPSNIKTIVSGSKVTVPDSVVEANCWTKYDTTRVECNSCPVSLECMTEQFST